MRSKIASKIYNETPESTKQKVRGMANAIVYDANTFGPDEVPVWVTAFGITTGYTKCVLIDLTGYRVDFTFYIGWFDHHTQEWKFKDRAHRPISKSEAVTMGMRWSFLPLAIYDTNPELRKTIKL